jgi:hypothetical protein
MTRQFERLLEGPQIGIHRSELNLDERQLVRRIHVRGTTGINASNSAGKFTTVYYLEGDEKEASRLFVDKNSELIEKINLSERNIIQTSVDRDIYDWILHMTGQRRFTKFSTVVLEERPDETTWVIGRTRYDENYNRRYSTTGSGSAKVPPTTSIREIYERFDDVISQSDLMQTEIEGDVRQVLDYYRVSPEFNCSPITTKSDELGVKKN